MAENRIDPNKRLPSHGVAHWCRRRRDPNVRGYCRSWLTCGVGRGLILCDSGRTLQQRNDSLVTKLVCEDGYCRCSAPTNNFVCTSDDVLCGRKRKVYTVSNRTSLYLIFGGLRYRQLYCLMLVVGVTRQTAKEGGRALKSLMHG